MRPPHPRAPIAAVFVGHDSGELRMSIRRAASDRPVRGHAWRASEEWLNLAVVCVWAMLGISATALPSSLARSGEPTVSIADRVDGLR
jgi:hypothetical protein